MKYITIIKSHYTGLSKSEKKVADYFINEGVAVIYKTLTDISQDIKVGEATILRFVRKVGFVGFQDIKLEIAKEDKPKELIYGEDYITRIANNINMVIKSNQELLKKESILKAIEIIENANNIFIFGCGASGIAANEASNRFMRIGKITNPVIDSHFQIMYATMTTKDDIIIAISLSGETLDIIEAISIAKKNGTKIIAITNYVLSSIAKIADCVLLTAGKENPLDGGSLVSKISQLYIIDILTTGVALKDKENVISIKNNMARHLVIKTKN